MRIRKLILTLMLGLLAACGAASQEPATKANSVDKYRRCDMQVRMFDGYCYLSIFDLIANPELFDGKKVMVQGYVHFEFEGDAIYLHKEDFLYSSQRNAVWVELDSAKILREPDYAKNLKECQDTYAFVRGTFRAGIGGHFDMFSGVLHDIANCTVMERRHE